MKSDSPAHRLLLSNLRSQWRRPSDYTPSTVQHHDTGRPCKKTLSTGVTFHSQEHYHCSHCGSTDHWKHCVTWWEAASPDCWLAAGGGTVWSQRSWRLRTGSGPGRGTPTAGAAPPRETHGSPKSAGGTGWRNMNKNIWCKKWKIFGWKMIFRIEELWSYLMLEAAV